MEEEVDLPDDELSRDGHLSQDWEGLRRRRLYAQLEGGEHSITLEEGGFGGSLQQDELQQRSRRQ